MSEQLIIASRCSQLALWQSEHVKSLLLQRFPQLKITILSMKTEGDLRLAQSLSTIGGKGLFVKELEQALLEKRAHIAVHSMKDVPSIFPAGLILGAILPREDPRDVLITQAKTSFDQLKVKARIGSCSLRRQAQLLTLRPDCTIELLRGNVPTRLKKLQQGEYDAIVLAAAGLKRLALLEDDHYIFSPEQMLPAVGQGALGIECREDDQATRQLLEQLQDPLTTTCVMAERAMNHCLEGGCQAPIAGFAEIQDSVLQLRGKVMMPTGEKTLQAELSGDITEFDQIGKQVADSLLQQGAKKIINYCKNYAK